MEDEKKAPELPDPVTRRGFLGRIGKAALITASYAVFAVMGGTACAPCEDCCTSCTGTCTGCTSDCTGCTSGCTGCTSCTSCTDCIACTSCTSCTYWNTCGRN
ncbi:MAG: hypothetical protein MUE73_21855 [Planctomycetes bacterium]|nr:hypothetical protein [Planctomycetota bacterium]